MRNVVLRGPPRGGGRDISERRSPYHRPKKQSTSPPRSPQRSRIDPLRLLPEPGLSPGAIKFPRGSKNIARIWTELFRSSIFSATYTRGRSDVGGFDFIHLRRFVSSSSRFTTRIPVLDDERLRTHDAQQYSTSSVSLSWCCRSGSVSAPVLALRRLRAPALETPKADRNNSGTSQQL